ncbi:MAG: ABC transporter [Richelia sp. SL_2_1]|nr:ABC transporter [Richelia sp. SM1_7_0]NJN08263.1 ABC transporter [Richelia sp. RM1_1_1]NJO26339.1 ABC transporter [Richelia sp. SL_2_1]
MKLPVITNLVKKFSQEPPLGWSQLSHQKIRLLIAMSGIAFADILIFMMLGFKSMLFDGSVLVHEHLNADLVLVSKRTKTLLETRGFPKAYLYQATDVKDVASSSPLYYSFGAWVNPWKKEIAPVAVIAFDPYRPVFDLPQLNQQLDQIKLPNVVLFDRKSQPTTGHVVESFNRGETVTTELSGRRVKVGGIFTLGSTMFIRGHIVTSDQNYLRLFGRNSIDQVHVGVLKLKPRANREIVAENLRSRLPSDIRVLNLQEFKKLELAFWSNEHPAGTIFNFGAIMGFVVGVVIVYQILYTDVSDHLAEYATLKAMGYSDIRLLVIVFQQGIILAIMGFAPGYTTSIGMYALLGKLTRIPLIMKSAVAWQVLIATVLMCLISAAIAMRKFRSADPADVF